MVIWSQVVGWLFDTFELAGAWLAYTTLWPAFLSIFTGLVVYRLILRRIVG